MTRQDEERDSVEEVQVPKSGVTAVVVLSVALGVVLVVGMVGAYWHLQASDSLQAEVRSVRAKLTEKSLALDEMKNQVEALSSQMHALREYSVARSGAAPVKDAKVPEAAVAQPAAPASDTVAAVKDPSTRAKETTPAGEKKNTKRPAATCELVGKSPEEQAATLKRCVELIDAR